MIKYWEFASITEYEGNILLLIDTETLKHSYRIGLDTLLVWVVNYEYFVKIKLTLEYSAWAVQSQGWNLTELAGICSNGGTCGLMR